MTGRRRDGNETMSGLLEAGETVVVELNGAIPGFTRWSGVGGIIGIVIALSVPRLLDLSFLVGALVIVAVMALVFFIVYSLVGKPLAARNKPPMSSPYLALVLTNRRVALFDRALGADAPVLVEIISAEDVSTFRYVGARPLAPQRLGFVIRGTEHREYEFPRSEPVRRFVDAFGDGRLEPE